MTTIHLITGGERSGKSAYAEAEALRLSPQPVYIATARIWDEDFAERADRVTLMVCGIPVPVKGTPL